MRKAISLLMMLMLIPIALAQEKSATDVMKEKAVVDAIAGPLTPSGLFYFLDKGVDDLRLGFSSGAEKVRVAFEIADERIAEGQVEVDKNMSAFAAIAIADYENKLEVVDFEKAKLTDEEKEESVKGIEKRNIVLSNIIERFESDDNPNNDHALPALRKAKDKTKEKRESIRVSITLEKRKDIEELRRDIAAESKMIGEADGNVRINDGGLITNLKPGSSNRTRSSIGDGKTLPVGSTDTLELKTHSLFSVYGGG